MKDISIQTDHGTLAGTLFPAIDSSDSTPGALLIHGWKSDRDSVSVVAETLSKKNGITCLAIDLPGHGNSEGDTARLSRKDFLESVVTSYDFLAEQENIEAQNIGVHGASFGGYLASLLTAERNLAWMALRVPADYPDEGFQEPRVKTASDPDTNAWRQNARSTEESAALRAVHAFNGPILIVEAENDAVIPQQTVLNYKHAADPNNVTYTVMENAPHSFSGRPDLKEEFARIMSEWLRDNAIGEMKTTGYPEGFH